VTAEFVSCASATDGPTFITFLLPTSACPAAGSHTNDRLCAWAFIERHQGLEGGEQHQTNVFSVKAGSEEGEFAGKRDSVADKHREMRWASARWGNMWGIVWPSPDEFPSTGQGADDDALCTLLPEQVDMSV
jgi:hypothetical protein